MWDSQGSVLPLLGDCTCAHKVHYHLMLMTPPICISSRVTLPSSRPLWPNSSILPGCLQTILNPGCSTRELSSSPFLKLLSPTGLLVLVLTSPSIPFLKPKAWRQYLLSFYLAVNTSLYSASSIASSSLLGLPLWLLSGLQASNLSLVHNHTAAEGASSLLQMASRCL